MHLEGSILSEPLFGKWSSDLDEIRWRCCPRGLRLNPKIIGENSKNCPFYRGSKFEIFEKGDVFGDL